MGSKDKRVDAYIKKAAPFARPILERIRDDFHKASKDVEEDIKWGVPAFMHEGIVGGMTAFKKHVGVGFWHASALPDPEGLFPDGGGSFMRVKLTEVADLPGKRVLQGYVKRAVAYNAALAKDKKAGAKKVAKKRTSGKPAAKAPPELAAAFKLKKHAKAKAFFGGLPPSAKREYCEWISEAKREATKEKRLATTLEWLGEGKRRHWKYEKC